MGKDRRPLNIYDPTSVVSYLDEIWKIAKDGWYADRRGEQCEDHFDRIMELATWQRH